jgi:hypothetical protein
MLLLRARAQLHPIEQQARSPAKLRWRQPDDHAEKDDLQHHAAAKRPGDLQLDDDGG